MNEGVYVRKCEECAGKNVREEIHEMCLEVCPCVEVWVEMDVSVGKCVWRWVGRNGCEGVYTQI